RPWLRAFPPVEAAAAPVPGLIAPGVVPAALEMMDQAMAVAVENWLHGGLPVEAAALLLAEVVGETAAVEAEAELIRRVGTENRARPIELAAGGATRGVVGHGP